MELPNGEIGAPGRELRFRSFTAAAVISVSYIFQSSSSLPKKVDIVKPF
jgi:hypothetical protein